LCADFSAQGIGVDVVDERALPVDLDDGEPLTVPGLELGVAADVDLLELDARSVQDVSCPLAEVATLRVVERDPRYG